MSGFIKSIVDQHAEEASFLWLVRRVAVYAPHYSLGDLTRLDDRLEAHLDGLRVAGDAGWEICKEALGLEGPGEVFAAAVLAFESKREDRVAEVLEVGSQTQELSRGLISALGWISYRRAEEFIKQLLGDESSSLRRTGIAAAAVHRQDPGPALIASISHSDSLLKARALRAVGQLGRIDLLPQLRNSLAMDDEMCRFSASWSTALLTDDAKAVDTLKLNAKSKAPFREKALPVVVRRMKQSHAADWLNALAQDPTQIRLAVTGAGIVGDPAFVPWLIEQMKIADLARVAGEAFSMITGADITLEKFEGEKPEDFESGPTENPEDEDVEMDLDENLPWPDPAAIQRWWKNHQSQFLKGTRYLIGQPIGLAWLQQVLRTGRQRQRAAAALELAIRQPGKPLFEVRAPGFRQRQLLG
jgi:uncharacterized protein (TIGR02270 family)